ncbi:P-loop containing nucleoside triphosphate hydrolase protein [Tuber borchii]|uniref:P-loop containing nucleoside triphosphate hydrolase protein n=1 Tax=Tuber borchii TaxID=42251 RepID=A0A2T6ZBA6_TUBBO|nr:P-loop containing nucleoside triphosphate hydrolase protein [Tuber borchii]
MSGPSRLQNGGVRKTNASSTMRAPATARPSSRNGTAHPQSYMTAARMGAGALPSSPAGSVASVSSRARGNTSPTKRRIKKDFPVEEPPPQQEDNEANINVVVRCRGRSEREIRENSGVVVSTPGGLRGKEISLSMGPLALSNKTYTFDRVFGPEANQNMIYDNVVAPILEEMLSGYNCTIFAYGQTGTGKTYTMSGDMADNFGTYSDSAGIIPRALYQLFHKLGIDEADNSVKCSFIELYNEELKDLLASDENNKVKIFEDSTRKGIVIQGMEESFIKNAEDGVKLLQEGSHKRQVAATKCNDLSSRSHTVFTITVHVKEIGEDGEDLLRTGKLNLVDLAGSENIGRSGAENKRAREAGMINQSLLTLGRVINALVDKSPHIPYRESKLTRLLQDSLGGRTKTCIIATVSPAKSNLEETISTLDYAARAKNIRNKPQINQMLTKKALIREYVTEIEKLKGDLMATRQKNGVFLTTESYSEMTEESESRRILNEEQQRKIDVMETQIKNTREQFEQNMRLFLDLKKELEGTKGVLEETKGELRKTETDLSSTRKDLADETVLREAHEKTEEELKSVGQKLITRLDETVHDVSGLHAKIRRMTDLEVVNHSNWMKSSGQVSTITELVEKEIGTFTEQQEKITDRVSERMSTFVATETKKLESAYEYIEARLGGFNDGEAGLSAETMKAKDEMNHVLEEIKILRENVKQKVGEGLKGLNEAAQRISAEVVEDLGKFGVQLHNSYSQLGREFKAIFDDAEKRIIAQKAEAEKLRLQLGSAAAAAVIATDTAQSSLDLILREERERATTDRQNLISQIAALVNATAEDQDKRLTKRVQLVQGEILMVWGEEKFINELVISQDSLKKILVQDWQDAEKHNASIQATTQAINAQTVRLVDAQMQDVGVQMQALDEFVTRARSQNEAHFEAFTQNLSGLSETVRESYSRMEGELNSFGEDLDSLDNDMSEQTSLSKELLEPFTSTTRQPLSELRGNIESAPLQEYVPTGETPKRRTYEYPTTLPHTQPHEELLLKPVTRRKSSTRTPLGEKEVHSPNKNVHEEPTDPKSGVFGKLATTGHPAYAHKIFFGTDIAAYTGIPARGGGGVSCADGGEGGQDEDDEPPAKRTRGQKLAVARGGYSAGSATGPAAPITAGNRKRSR